MSDSALVYVQDHSFLVADSQAATPFETADYSTGLAGLMSSAAMIYAGIDRGNVTVSVQVADTRPSLDDPERWAALADWEDIAEVTLHTPRSDLRVDQLQYGGTPSDPRTPLPTLSPFGPGHYRLRIHSRGRDRHYDQAITTSDESFHLIAWPEPPSPPVIIKSNSKCGYGLLLSGTQTSAPAPTHTTPTQEQDEATAHQAMLDRALRRNRQDD